MDTEKLDPNSYAQKYGEDALRDETNNLIDEALDDLPALEAEAAETQAKDKADKQEQAALQKVAFIKDKNTRADFVKLQNSPPSKERNLAMINIIRDNLDWATTKAGKRKYPLATAANFRRILTFDPLICGLFGYEEFKGEIVFIRQPYWSKSSCVNSQWTDFDDSRLRIHLRENYADICSKLTTDDLFNVVAKENSFNIVKDYLESLPSWDGVKRAESLFIDFLKVEDTPFARAVTFKWLLAAVCRIFYPACTFQAAIVLQGNQNVGKSYILERLGGAWYGCLIDDVDDTHAVDAIKNLWIVELKEMAAARKSEINATKSFLERPADNYRAAYAKRVQTFKRHCVFAISVNDRQFLRDLTGNRRYWILESPLAEFEYVNKLPNGESLSVEYIQQIWAEVFETFKELTADGFNDKVLELPLEFKLQAESVAEKFTVNDGLASEIGAFLNIPIPPPIIWGVLTKTEKRNFFKQNYIELDDGDWQQRKKRLKTETDKEEFDAALDPSSKFIRTIETPRGKDHSTLSVAVYGSYIRQKTCASEILNECFTSGDNRKKIFRIVEVLNNLDGWRKFEGKREKDFNGYGDQKRIYFRITQGEEENETTETPVPKTPPGGAFEEPQEPPSQDSDNTFNGVDLPF